MTASVQLTLRKSGRHPLMRQQLVNLACSLRRQPRQHILEISIRIMPVDARRLDQTHDRPARLPLRSDPANNQFDRPSAHGRIKFSIWLLSMGTAPSSR